MTLWCSSCGAETTPSGAVLTGCPSCRGLVFSTAPPAPTRAVYERNRAVSKAPDWLTVHDRRFLHSICISSEDV
jgi:hypothetical protein